MIKRFHIHNFRCLENFDLPISGLSSVLLIGKNGTGKSTVGLALQILQRIARGANRVGELVQSSDFTRGRTDTPMRFEIEVELDESIYSYAVAFELPSHFKELRVSSESLSVDGQSIYTRETAQVRLPRINSDIGANFRIDWHLVALPIIQRSDPHDVLGRFKSWLASSLVLQPVHSLISGESNQETLQPRLDMSDLGAWFSGLLASAPSAYLKVDTYLKQVMPDLRDMKNLIIGTGARKLVVQFSNKQGSATIPFNDLSAGEKSFVIYALVIAANDAFGPLLCFWDEPDNNLAPSEVGASMLALRQAFKNSGQIITTSHHPEAIRRFSDENTLYFYRESHLEPTIVRPLTEIRESGDLSGDLVGALVRGDIEA